jgi:hypothetical protein
VIENRNTQTGRIKTAGEGVGCFDAPVDRCQRFFDTGIQPLLLRYSKMGKVGSPASLPLIP